MGSVQKVMAGLVLVAIAAGCGTYRPTVPGLGVGTEIVLGGDASEGTGSGSAVVSDEDGQDLIRLGGTVFIDQDGVIGKVTEWLKGLLPGSKKSKVVPAAGTGGANGI